MTDFDIEWAIGELDVFISQTVMTNASGPGFVTPSDRTAASNENVTKQAVVVERIFDRVIPGWRAGNFKLGNNRWASHREVAIRSKELLLREEEIRKHLGDDSPQISASNLHPWVWSGAASLWNSGHYRSAVEDALKKVNAETQNKIGRRDISETKLFTEAFSEGQAEIGRPRLRRMKPEVSETYKSLQRGARAIAEGIYAGIRNPLNHLEPTDISEQVALEYLAALSILARWVDESEVEVVGE